MAWFVLIGIFLLCVCLSKSDSKTNNYTAHYPGDYTTNHTPPPSTDSTMPTKRYPGGDTSSLNKEFEKSMKEHAEHQK